jgi:uridine phosphorylase
VPAFLRPTNSIHADALLPGDPARALALAQDLLVEPKMCNHARGLWGYSGRSSQGHELTIQSTGIGGPSTAAVVSELAEAGVRRAVRVGTCTAVVDELELGDLVLAREAVGCDGVSRQLGADGPQAPDAGLGAALDAAGGEAGAKAVRVASIDLHAQEERPAWLGHEPDALDLATAPLLALAPRLGIAAAAILVVAESGEERIEDEPLAEASLRAGRAGLAALSS